MKLRTIWIAVFAALGAIAQAEPEFLDILKKTYLLKADSAISEAKCATCHTNAPKRNAYGNLVREKLGNQDLFTAAVLKATEGVDTDGDGAMNGDELKAGTLPADPNSKPAVGKSEAGSASDIHIVVPKHSFHPAVSHFPLALFAIAAVFGFLGQRKNNDAYLKASVLNLGVGLLLSILTIGTGIIAMLRLGYAIEGTMLTHLLLASGSTLLGIAAYTQREKKGYLPILVLCGLLVLVAGHFGGDLVYGG
jgi:uncharacterized membrane protein